MKKIILILIFAAVLTLCILSFHDMIVTSGSAEQPAGTTAAYVVCVPGDYVNIRSRPNTRCEVIGRFEPGEEICLDGTRQGDFLHCVGLRLETDEGWIHRGYVLNAEPELIDRDGRIRANGRVAARKNVDGKRTRWLKNGTKIHIYYWTDGWSLTNKGYLKSEYLEIDYSEAEE